jgi:hypothetical protein
MFGGRRDLRAERAVLSVRFVIHLIKLWLNPAFPVPLLEANHFPHQISLAGVAQQVRLSAWFAAGTVWRRCSVVHCRILLKAWIHWHSTHREPLSIANRCRAICRDTPSTMAILFQVRLVARAVATHSVIRPPSRRT